jgi:predicted RNase H-like HicB family nuclease
MPFVATIRDHKIQVYWDDLAEYFIAEIPEIFSCAADGTSPCNAVLNFENTFAVLRNAYAETGLEFTKSSPGRGL